MGYKQIQKIQTTEGIKTLTQWPITITNNRAYVSGMDTATMHNFVLSTRLFNSEIVAAPDSTMITIIEFANHNKIRVRKEGWGSSQWGALYVQYELADGTYYWGNTFQRYDPMGVYGNGACKNILILIIENESDPTDIKSSLVALFNDDAPYGDWGSVLSNMFDFFNGSFVTNDPYQQSPETSPEGGYGDFDYSSDDTDFSRLPTLSACDVGFCTLYKMSSSDVKDLATYLWGLGSLASFLPIFSDPMECILSLGIIPVTPATGSSDLIKVGNLTTTVYGAKITKQFDILDCGSITLDGSKYSNSFMDYSPYTKAELFLPYIGTVSLDIDEVMDASSLHLQYQFDLLSGACIAELKVTKKYNYKSADHVHENVLYRYSGNILSNVPITGANYTQMYQAIVSAVATGIGGAAGAETAKTAAGAEAIQDKATLSNIGTASGMKGSIKRAGNATANCGYLGGQTPELILSLPKLAHIGEAQGKEFGFPRYGEYTLSDLKGYTKIMQIHLKSIKCTDEERSMIESALNGGVIISSNATPTQSATSNTIIVYSYTCDRICLNKADGWSLIDTVTGKWRDDSIDILHPEINIIATNSLTQAKILKEANYVYIADFDRYYYIKGMKANSGNLITLSLEVDACMSWLTAIKAEKAVVDRQEEVWTMHLSDGYIKTYNTPYTVVKKFPTGFSAENFILAVAGG